MIGWMQKHRKYLVVTIWVSTIAFVGAGFVGWGAYNFSSSSGSVAKVGETEISIKELQQEYSRLYNYYNSMLKGAMDEEKAKAFKLQESALNTLIQDALLQNFARDLGLFVTDEESAKKILEIKEFQVNGTFDKKLYVDTLNHMGMKVADFEESFKKRLLSQKVLNVLQLPVTDMEIKALSSALSVQDRIKIEILDANKYSPSIQENDIKGFWEANREKYLTVRTFEGYMVGVQIESMSATEDEIKEHFEKQKSSYIDARGGVMAFEDAKDMVKSELLEQKAKKEALTKYVELKKDPKIGIKTTIKEGDTSYPAEFLAELSKIKPGETLKPIKKGGAFIVFSLEKISEPQPKEYEKAKESAKADLKKARQLEMLKEDTNRSLANFNGRDIGFVSVDDVSKIEGLESQDAMQFLQKLFESTQKRGVITLSDKAIIFEIVEQKLLESNVTDAAFEFLPANIASLKSKLVHEWLVGKLQNRYKIETY